MAKRKKVVRMSAATLAKRKATKARAARHKATEQRKIDRDIFLSLVGQGLDYKLPRSLRAPRRRKRTLPPGVSRDPETGQFVPAGEIMATRAYRAESRRVKRVKRVKSRRAKKSHAAQRKRMAAMWKHRPSF